MPKRKPEIRMRSFGIYSKWDADSKKLPRIVEFTTQVPATLDVEFGFIVHIKGAKNQELEYCIAHPGICDDKGDTRPAFDGSVFIKENEWDFFLGDTIWDPISDKLGPWHLSLKLDEKIVAEKTFNIIAADSS